MDISSTIQANSAQVNADDLTGTPRTVTITDVEKGTSEQPVFIHLQEFPGRTYRPGVSMRRVLVANALFQRIGTNLAKRARDIYAECATTNTWPSVTGELIGPPNWMVYQHEEEVTF